VTDCIFSVFFGCCIKNQRKQSPQLNTGPQGYFLEKGKQKNHPGICDIMPERFFKFHDTRKQEPLK